MVIESRNYCNDKLAISTPSIIIDPYEASKILNKLNVIVDFPAPVLPTIPTFYRGAMLKHKSFNAGAKLAL